MITGKDDAQIRPERRAEIDAAAKRFLDVVDAAYWQMHEAIGVPSYGPEDEYLYRRVFENDAVQNMVSGLMAREDIAEHFERVVECEGGAT